MNWNWNWNWMIDWLSLRLELVSCLHCLYNYLLSVCTVYLLSRLLFGPGPGRMNPTAGSSVLDYHTVSYISDGKSMIRDTIRLRVSVENFSANAMPQYSFVLVLVPFAAIRCLQMGERDTLQYNSNSDSSSHSLSVHQWVRMTKTRKSDWLLCIVCSIQVQELLQELIRFSP